MTPQEKIEPLIAEERIEANKKHGEAFADWNHAFGVMHEEYLEVMKEIECIKKSHEDIEKLLCCDDDANNELCYDGMRNFVENAIQELIQLAGVCDKALGKPIAQETRFKEKQEEPQKCNTEVYSEKTVLEKYCKHQLNGQTYADILAIICSHGCTVCPLRRQSNGKNLYCVEFVVKYPEETVEIMNKWIKEHGVN